MLLNIKIFSAKYLDYYKSSIKFASELTNELKFTTMNIYDEMVEILNSKKSKRAKDRMLLKLGIRKCELHRIWDSYKHFNMYRPSFDIDGLTFGVEMECVNAPVSRVTTRMQSNGIECQYLGYTHRTTPSFKLVSDSSLQGNNTIECVSPILKGESGENLLKNACKALSEAGAGVNRSCGLHIHFGAENMTDKHYINIFKNYQKIENAIDEVMPESRKANNSRWCYSLVRFNFEFCQTKSDVAGVICTRYTKVNSQSYNRHKTIEFRQHSGTINYTKIMGWVKFLKDLIKFSEKNVLTENVNHIEDLSFVSDETMAYLKARKEALA